MIFKFDDYLTEKAAVAEEMCSEAFNRFDKIARHNSEKVLHAFIKNRVSERHLQGTTGYGYGDDGRDTLDKVYADVFGAESALVRHNFINGTHAIATALFGVLRTGDTLMSVTGKPYDTLHGVINGDTGGSLKEYGIHYKEIALLPSGKPDLESIRRVVGADDSVRPSDGVRNELLTLVRPKAYFIQRSRGYSLRPSITVSEIGEIIKIIRSGNPDAIIIVDNCYGEFCECTEPVLACLPAAGSATEKSGADLIIGSLIKNPGGGIAETGGYIAGKADLVELSAQRLTAPGIGSEAGCSLDRNRSMYMGLFRAPETVANALKTSAFALALFELMGYECFPNYNDYRTDIIAAIKLGGEAELRAFCEGIQAGSPVDSYAVPEPWEMPGYAHKVIMAAGAFVSGASIELSADAPLREPYAVWLQGGLTFPSGRIGVMTAAQKLLNLKK
ncbi:MAG: methionine gamma-lyase family protein [Oscillospiraceae bacterium]|nr:methionine gamma-lyase family protein [Oscillospiraceae bacterium]